MVKINTFAPVADDKVFWFSNGKSAKNIGQLYKEIKDLPDHEFQKHCNDQKNDFYNWVFDVVQDVELAKEMLGCTDKKTMLGTLQTYFEILTKPSEPKVLNKVMKKPMSSQETKKKVSQQELKEKPSNDVLTKVLNLRPKRQYKTLSPSHRNEILKNLKEVYKVGR